MLNKLVDKVLKGLVEVLNWSLRFLGPDPYFAVCMDPPPTKEMIHEHLGKWVVVGNKIRFQPPEVPRICTELQRVAPPVTGLVPTEHPLTIGGSLIAHDVHSKEENSSNAYNT